MGGELYQEVRALLESSQVILPPFVSSKVIMLAQQWVEGAPAPQEREGGEEASCGQGESQNTITLPGGAVLVARPAQGGGGASPRPAISQEAPDVSITLGAKTRPPTPPSETGGPPARVLASLAALALPLACLPSLLAVYREVRDSYKGLVMADYLVSWTQLVTARLRSAGLMASEPAGRARETSAWCKITYN